MKKEVLIWLTKVRLKLKKLIDDYRFVLVFKLVSYISFIFICLFVRGGGGRRFYFRNWDPTFYNLLQREDFCVFNHYILKQKWRLLISITPCNFHVLFPKDVELH